MHKHLQIAALSVAVAFNAGRMQAASSCAVLQHAAPTEADTALLAADYPRAVLLYQTALVAHPGDMAATIGLVHTLLHQQKVAEAAEQAKAAAKSTSSSAALLTLRGEVELREGMPWIAVKSANDAVMLDPCNPRTHLLLANLARMNSLYATSHAQLELAHKLDPADPEIRRKWLATLPLKRRIEEMQAYLATPSGDDEDAARHGRLYLASLQKMLAEPPKPCHLVSPVASAEIPFIRLMRDATHMAAYGLEPDLNGHKLRLKLDTGASGLVISRSAAEHAGLKAFSATEIGGIGDKGAQAAYSAYADSIRIGGLEFQNCSVHVVDSRGGVGGSDGLMGMDVFSSFLVTLDFPMRKLVLGPLPPRPGQAAMAPALSTGEAAHEDVDAATDASGKAAAGKADPANQSAPTAPLSAGQHGPYDRYIAPEMKDYTAIYRVGHQLLVPTRLNDNPPDLLILDTGTWSTTLSPQAARQVGKLHVDPGAHVHGLSGDVDKVYTSDEVTFHFANMSQTARELPSFDNSGISKSVGMEVSGFLGASTLEQMTIHIDYRDGLVKFEYDPARGYKN